MEGAGEEEREQKDAEKFQWSKGGHKVPTEDSSSIKSPILPQKLARNS